MSRRLTSLCPGGGSGVCIVHQEREDEKNSSEFFDRERRRAFGSSPVSGLMTLNTPESVTIISNDFSRAFFLFNPFLGQFHNRRYKNPQHPDAARFIYPPV